jgi:hypothetical protein
VDAHPAVLDPVVRAVHANRRMYKIVRCPESDQLELVECVDTPLGNLIHRCTAFRPVCAMKCTRGCAVELDHAMREGRTRGPIVERDGQFELEPDEDLEITL